MALRVARGLFRLWLILSVLWVGGVAFMAWQLFADIDKFETLATRCDEPGNPFDKKLACSDPLAAKAAASNTAAEERRSTIWHTSLLAFLPPAFVLALGSALVWAFSGFAESDAGRKGKRP
jgi:hypothetical protein